MKWYIETDRYAKIYTKNAGSKAPADIAEIYRKSGMKALIFPLFPKEAKSEVYKKIWLLTKGTFPWIKVFCKVRKGDVIFLNIRFTVFGLHIYGFLSFANGKDADLLC